MNIFTVLSQGKGRLNEENLSAMLGFLLSPTQTHGLGDIFLRRFLTLVAQECGEKHRFDDILASEKPIQAGVLLESVYSLGKKRRIIDIEVQILTRSFNPVSTELEVTEVHRIAIENKVKASSAALQQFKEEFQGILEDAERDEHLKVTMVFLTPPGKHLNLSKEYQTLNEELIGKHKKSWLHWSDDPEKSNHITALIKGLLDSEAKVEIPPMTEYLRHTLKAFVRHIEESPAGTSTDRAKARKTTEPGGIVETVLVEIARSKYQIERYESSTIRVFNLDKQEYEAAWPILKKINTEKKLGVDLRVSSGNWKNTRTLGRDVVRALVNQEKA